MPQIGSALGIFHSLPLSLYLQQNRSAAAECSSEVFFDLNADANFGKGMSGFCTLVLRFKLIGLFAPTAGGVVGTEATAPASVFVRGVFCVTDAEEAAGAEVVPALAREVAVFCLFIAALLSSPIELKNAPTQCDQDKTFNNLKFASASNTNDSFIIPRCSTIAEDTCCAVSV